jgi:hypothetical protein
MEQSSSNLCLSRYRVGNRNIVTKTGMAQRIKCSLFIQEFSNRMFRNRQLCLRKLFPTSQAFSCCWKWIKRTCATTLKSRIPKTEISWTFQRKQL